jgi:hypothetical protein|tara:strand:- start:403 stop:621 length:219 start_codon:yes stop_codon:yes gene_type:complete
MRIYIVIDRNRNEGTYFFDNKRKADKYFNFIKDTTVAEFKIINVKPNRKGILYAMEVATQSVGSSCGDLRYI